MAPRTRAKTNNASTKDAPSTIDPYEYIRTRMRHTIVALENQKEKSGLISLGESTLERINEIVEYCTGSGHQIPQSVLGDLVRLLDKQAMCQFLSAESYIGVTKLILLTENDVYRDEGLKLLLSAMRDIICKNQGDYKEKDAQVLVISSALRNVLNDSLLKEARDSRSHKIIRDLIEEFNISADISTTESPLNVSKPIMKQVAHPNQGTLDLKRKRNEVPGTYDDSSVFDIPDDEIATEFLVNSQATRKPNVVKFGPQGPLNQVKLPYAKRRRIHTGGVTEDGSPVARTRDVTTTKPVLTSIIEATIAQKPLKQKKKDRLLDSAKKVTTLRPDKGTPVISRQKAKSGEQQVPETIVDSAPCEVQIRASTPAITIVDTTEVDSAMFLADDNGFDQYFAIEDGSWVQPISPENVFSSPVRSVPPIRVPAASQDHDLLMSSEKHDDSDYLADDSLDTGIASHSSIVDSKSLEHASHDKKTVRNQMRTTVIGHAIGRTDQRLPSTELGLHTLEPVRESYPTVVPFITPKPQQTHGVHTDPEKTLIDAGLPVGELVAPEDEICTVSSTTTEPRSSPEPILIEDPNPSEKMIADIQGLGSEFVLVLQPLFSMLVDTFSPIQEAAHLQHEALEGYSKKIQQAVVSRILTFVRGKVSSQRSSLSAAIDARWVEIRRLTQSQTDKSITHTSRYWIQPDLTALQNAINELAHELHP